MICYASVTGTKRNLAALRAAGWRLFLSRTGNWAKPDDFAYALDNGAWTDAQLGQEFDDAQFEEFLGRFAYGADFIVVPDIVAGGLASLDLSRRWMPRLVRYGVLLLIAVQDGMEPDDVADLIGPRVGIFLGGTTEWKIATMAKWGKVALNAGAYFHVGRVNTARRIRMAHAAEANSIDGTSATRFACTLPLLDGAARQRDLFSVRA